VHADDLKGFSGVPAVPLAEVTDRVAAVYTGERPEFDKDDLSF